jgi:hypothetical protein
LRQLEVVFLIANMHWMYYLILYRCCEAKFELRMTLRRLEMLPFKFEWLFRGSSFLLLTSWSRDFRFPTAFGAAVRRLIVESLSDEKSHSSSRLCDEAGEGIYERPTKLLHIAVKEVETGVFRNFVVFMLLCSFNWACVN